MADRLLRRNPVNTYSLGTVLTTTPLIWYDNTSFDAIGIWYDMSGNKHHAGSPTANKPTIVSSGIGGKPTIRFNGTNQYLETPAIPALDTNKVSWFVVFNTSNISSVRFLVACNYADNIGGSTSNLFNQWSSFASTGNSFQTHTRNNGGTAVGEAKTPYDTNNHITTGVWNATLFQGWFDDISNSGEQILTTANPSGHNWIRIGSSGAVVPTQYHQGDISEIIIYNRAISGAERTTITNYLNAKYSIF